MKPSSAGKLADGASTARRVLDYPVPTRGRVLFVSPAVAKSGSADGSASRPFASLHDAVAQVRKERAARGASQLTDADRATIVLRAGTHVLGETLTLGSEDSFLTFQAYPGEDAAVSGSVPLTGVTWTQGKAPARQGYEYRAGVADAGFTLETGSYATLSDAQARCSALPLCAGITANVTTPNPTGPTNYAMLYIVYYARGSGSSVWTRNVGYGPGESPNVWTADLSALGLKANVAGVRIPGDASFGGVKRGIRARYPNMPAAELQGAMQIDADSWTPQSAWGLTTNANYTFNPATPLRNDSTQDFFQVSTRARACVSVDTTHVA